MGDSAFVQKSDLFAYSGTNCLRNDYFHNDCSLCIDICPEGAFHLVRNKLTLFENECIACAACIGGCPTEALGIENFDPNRFTVAFEREENKRLSCKQSTPCLGAFDSHHLITMALRSEMPPVCDMAHCAECTINKEGRVEGRIRGNIEAANAFFTRVGYDAKIVTIEEKPEENARRALFRKVFDKAKEAVADKPDELNMTLAHQRRIETTIPLKNLLLKNSIKQKIESFSTTLFDEPSELFFRKSISFDACTNCGDCTQFCPTDALFPSSDKQGIYFGIGKCIGCSICDHICKSDAISTEPGFDLVSVAFDHAEQLVHYDMVMCHECRCPYPYKGGDPICDRCKGFKADFGDMFTMAKDS